MRLVLFLIGIASLATAFEQIVMDETGIRQVAGLAVGTILILLAMLMQIRAWWRGRGRVDA